MALDLWIGGIYKMLSKRGQLDQPLYVFFNDHGSHPTALLSFQKNPLLPEVWQTSDVFGQNIYLEF
jgi:arylsulfatase A-like enzyme